MRATTTTTGEIAGSRILPDPPPLAAFVTTLTVLEGAPDGRDAVPTGVVARNGGLVQQTSGIASESLNVVTLWIASRTPQLMDKDSEKTHFGFATVDARDKARRVKGVFDSVSERYDLMNDLMSGGLHRLWKRFAVEQAGLRPGQSALDLAGGSGDLALQFARRVGDSGYVILADINAAMLSRGRARLIDAGVAGNLAVAQLDAEKLPFAGASFDRVAIAFGLRNVTDKEKALESMQRVLKPGGKLLILEFSRPKDAIQPVYDWYSFSILPVLGKFVAKDEASYRYLAESIRMHPDQETLLRMMEAAGFERCRYQNLSGGIVALHVGYKI